VSPADPFKIFANSQRKLFSLFSQALAGAAQRIGTVGTRLALLLIEQMLKRVTNFFNFNF
jgi:hypothetical protein